MKTTTNSIPVVQANPEIVRAGTEALRAAFEEFVNTFEQEVAFVDGFMIAHNIHKLLLEDLEQRQPPEEPRFLRRLAIVTFARALGENYALVEEGGAE